MKCLRTLIALVLPLILCAGPFAADSTSVVKVGVTIRSRIETTDNASYLDFGMNKSTSYLRNRTGLTLQVFPTSHYEVGIRAINEFRYYFAPVDADFDLDELVVDQAYVTLHKISGSPMSATFGRQNIVLGEGFVVSDGGPLDGSRTAYFDGAHMVWRFSETSELGAIYVNQRKHDDFFSLISEREKLMSEQNEHAEILHAATHFQSTLLEGYLILKHNSGSASIPDADFVCPGIRLQTQISPHASLTAEWAGQFGTWGLNDQRAFGGYAYTTLQTGLPIYYPKSLTFGFVYLSGDDYETPDHEGWEPVFGRWPKWSESYAYTLSRESGTAYWSNFVSLFARTSVALGTDLTLSLDYNYLLAPQKYDPIKFIYQRQEYEGEWFSYGRTIMFPGGHGKVRGHLFATKLAYQLKPRLSGHLIFELFRPGDYYFKDADRSAWMRMEMMLKF